MNSTESACKVEIRRWRNNVPFAYSMTCDEGTVEYLANALPVHPKYAVGTWD